MNTILHYGFASSGSTTFEAPLNARLLHVCEVDGGLRAYFLADEDQRALGVVGLWVTESYAPIPDLVGAHYAYAGSLTVHRTALASPDLEVQKFRPYLTRAVLHVFFLGPTGTTERKDAQTLSRRKNTFVTRHRRT